MSSFNEILRLPQNLQLDPTSGPHTNPNLDHGLIIDLFNEDLDELNNQLEIPQKMKQLRYQHLRQHIRKNSGPNAPY